MGVISTRGEENYSSRMFRHLEFLLNDLSLKLEQFDLFAVSAGPGSFTGLRVGLTAAKGWAEVYRKPVVGVSALEAVAIQCRAMTAAVVPVLDARRGQVYFGVYRRGGAGLRLAGDEFVVTPDEFVAKLSEWPQRCGGYDCHAGCGSDFAAWFAFCCRVGGDRDGFQRSCAVHRAYRLRAGVAWSRVRCAGARRQLRPAHGRGNAMEGSLAAA